MTDTLLGNGLHLGFEHPEFVDRVREGEIPVATAVVPEWAVRDGYCSADASIWRIGRP